MSKLFTVQAVISAYSYPAVEGAVARRITACPIIIFDEQSHSQPIPDIASRFKKAIEFLIYFTANHCN
jgi:hypothetical protein